jgi:uroporphyrin-III C-methyltransferase/precorrin-2 dehydrogenase/sirohydrochlorin ferrochelatase
VNRPLPFQRQVTHRPVLLIGAGEAAEAKLRLLAERDARVTHWSSAPSARERVAVEQANADPASRYVLAIIAGDADWARGLIDWVHRERMLLNVVDAPELADGFIPAIVSRGLLQIGIGSGGASPVLVRFIRTQIERVVPQQLDRLADFAARWQGRVRQVLPDVRSRRRFWERQLSGAAAESALAGDADAADQLMTLALQQSGPEPGRVSLVGAGPGDASLLTLQGLKRLQEADVVLYDKLVGPDVLALARRDARLEDVGKRRGHCPMPQEAICGRLVELAQQGYTVCRLKGGDPLLFGRGGEELQALAAAGIAVDIVPGVTTAAAVAASTGMPLTHRGVARSVRFITGHLALHQVATDWQALAARQETLGLYMGFSHLQDIAAALMAAGAAPDLPIAAVQNASRPEQRVVRGQLSDTAAVRGQLSLDEGPILIFIGDVTALQLGATVTPGRVPAAPSPAIDWRETA